MTTHAHRIRIDEPNGRRSMGRCACGFERSYGNSEEEMASAKFVRENFKLPGSHAKKASTRERFHNPHEYYVGRGDL